MYLTFRKETVESYASHCLPVMAASLFFLPPTRHTRLLLLPPPLSWIFIKITPDETKRVLWICQRVHYV